MKLSNRGRSRHIIVLALLPVLICALAVPSIGAVQAEDPPPALWVLTETLVNPHNAPTEFYGGGATPGWFEEARFEGKHLLYSVSRTSFGVDDREVDHGHEYHNCSIDVSFQEPPAQLIPGETVELAVSASHGGTAEDAGLGIQFWYTGDGVHIQPEEVLRYAPWHDAFDGTSSKTYSFEVPQAYFDGEEIEIYASLWNAEPSLVVWRYRAAVSEDETPAKEPEQKMEEPVEDEQQKPVIILPGIYGSYLASAWWDQREWIYNRGLSPDLLALDPLANYYDDMVMTLKNAGYVEGQDLFLGAYDWRMPPGPVDGSYDGVIQGISGLSITDELYEYGVDYLGHYLKQAAERWRADHDGEILDSVDIISHSTGGLVARAYVQSTAYGGHFPASDGEGVPLPRVRNLIMVAVPNRGAALPWQAMHNNFIRDMASKRVMSKLLAGSYWKLERGYTIEGPPAPITQESVRDPVTGQIDPVRFINAYCPTFRSLLATYPFLITLDGDLVDVNDRPEFRNDLVLDLNNGLDMHDRPAPADPSPFASLVEHTAVFFASEELTAHQMRERDNAAMDVVFPMDAHFEKDVAAGTIWYQDIADFVGDGTVPSLSAAGQFSGDGRIESYHVLDGDKSHTGLMGNPEVQVDILDILGIDWREVEISTGLAAPSGWDILFALSDPVGFLLVDGQGRRLGWTPDTGVLAEIPNSVWYGEGDGIGFVFGEVPQPLQVELVGMDGDYRVMVTGEQGDQRLGLTASGTLANGETKNAGIETRERLSAPAPVAAESSGSDGDDSRTLLWVLVVVYALVAALLVVLVVVLARRRRA
jgi:hypothetical protein